MAAPVCLVRRDGLQGYDASEEGRQLLEGLPPLHAVVSVCNVRGLMLKSLLHALGMGAFPTGPGLWAWHAMLGGGTSDAGTSASPLMSCLVLLLWGSVSAPRSAVHDPVLLDIGLLLSSVLVYASDEPAEQRLDRLLDEAKEA